MDKDDPVNQMNTYYDVRVHWHDRYMNHTTNAAMEKLLAPIICDVELIIMGKRVLEIACGTGNWTQVLAKRALSVTATDVNQSTLSIAKAKDMFGGNIEFSVCDAYELNVIENEFEVAFAADWFSHVPKQHYDSFLSGLHRRLEPGASVVFLDMDEQTHDREGVYSDHYGNLVRDRTLPNGQTFPVINNFPTKTELEALLKLYATELTYRHYPTLKRWMLTYKLKD